MAKATSFQYPLIGSNLCNHTIPHAATHPSRLSVPSHRVEPLQHSNLRTDGAPLCVFQYPLIGSNLCNCSKLCLLLCRNLAFSTLSSGRTSATCTRACSRSVASSFSTLSSGRTSATSARKCGGRFSSDFQYPLIGSNLCNFRALQLEKHPPEVTFSTLSSGRTSATEQRLLSQICEGGFQYPLIGSNLCNVALTCTKHMRFSLSVPSHRVEPLQL